MVTPVLRIDSNPKTRHFDHFQSPSAGEVLSGAWRYRTSTVLLFLVLVPLLALVVFLIPAKFDSTSQLLVRLGRGAISVDATANLSQTVSLQESRLAQVNSVKELLFSREVFERVATTIGPDRILEPHGIVDVTIASLMNLIPSRSAKAQGELSAEQVAAQIKLEEACKALYSAIEVSSPKEAYTINLQIRTGDPFLSRDIMHAYVEAYQKFHVESHQASGSLEFFEEQADEALVRATEKQVSLRDAKTNRGIVELSTAKQSLSASISVVKQSLLTTDGDLAATNAELENLQAQIAKLPANVESEVLRGIPKVAGSAMRQRLYDLEVAYQESAVKFTEDHPKMVALREQLDAASKIAKTEEGDQPQTREMINPIRQNLELAYKTTAARLAGTLTKKKSLEEQLVTLNKELVQLNQDEVDINQLSWEASLSESNYLRLAAARQTARQINDLDKQFLSEISIVQPATLMLKKASPKRSLLLMLGMMLAFGVAVGQAVLRSVLAASEKPVGPRRDHDSLISMREQAWSEPAASIETGATVDSDELVAAVPR